MEEKDVNLIEWNKNIERYREYVRRIIEGDDDIPLEEMLNFKEWNFRQELS